MLSRTDIERLPNPHLAHYVPDDIFALDEKDYQRAIRQAYLRAAHLADDYDDGTEEQKREARFRVLRSWFDPRKPDELCCDVDNFIAAHFLWVEFYLKPDHYIGGHYTMRDPIVKYDLVRASLAPSLALGLPSRTLMHCARGTTKTKTIIHEACSMMALVRPYTKILISEINADRTAEEIGNIREIFENNRLVQADFGGDGVLWSRNLKRRTRWCDKQLDFLANPSCSIQGYSIGAGQRGRHPIFGVIDDPEDWTTINDRAFRRLFLRNLFHRYIGMFYPGGHIVWIGSAILGSCLSMALQGALSESLSREELANGLEDVDERFRTWHKVHFDMIETDQESGERFSIMADHTSVEAYDKKVEAYGAAVVAAELDGRPIAEGVYALIRDEFKHAYMHCENDPRGEHHKPSLPNEYMLNLLTGQILPWEDFLEMLFKAGGCDIADSTARDACLGAEVIVGVNPERDVYALDCYAKRQIADDWPETALGMCCEWQASRQGFDTAAMQKVVYRMAIHMRLDMEERGLTPPSLVPVKNHGMNKHLRVLATLRPLYRRRAIFFPRFKPVTTPDGLTHYPAPHPHVRHFGELLRELDTYTDEGPSGHDDVADALQIAIVAAGRGKGIQIPRQDQNELEMAKWKEAGIDWSEKPQLVPREAWTAEMRERAQSEAEPEGELAEVGAGCDPYEWC